MAILLWAAAAAAQTKSPVDYLGFRVGDDYKLADWQQIAGYFDQLAKSSNRVRVDVIGQTTEKRPFLRVTITSPEHRKAGSLPGDHPPPVIPEGCRRKRPIA